MSSVTFDGVHVLVLGNGPRVHRARQLLTEHGAQLVRQFNAQVTYVVIDRTVSTQTPEVVAAKRKAVPVLTTAELQEWPGMESLANVTAPTSAPPVPSAPVTGVYPRMPHPHAPVPLPASAPPPAPAVWRPVPSRTDPQLVGLGWGGLSVVTLGTATPLLVGHAALKRESTSLMAAAAGYFVVPIGCFATWVYGAAFPGPAGDPFMLVAVLTWLACVGAGATHAFFLGERQAANRTGQLPVVSNAGNARALAAVERRRTLRQEARKLAERDPGAARELRIGRPDLAPEYDDGGLVDINNASVGALQKLPGVDENIAEAIVRHRETVGVFMSTSEVVVQAGLDPRFSDEFDELALYVS